MTTESSSVDYGVDVSKESLHIDGPKGLEGIANRPRPVHAWLKRVPTGACFAIEATGTYHVCFAELAHRLGHTVYLVDGFRLSRYRDSVGQRAKNDPLDAALLRRYLQREKGELTPWQPAPQGYTRLMRLLHRRERLVSTRTALAQSLADIPACRHSVRALLRRITAVIDQLERCIVTGVRESGWGEDMKRCRKIGGIGPLTSAGLAVIYQRGHFRSADAFIAFLGLDVRVRDSGKQRGKRKLTKKGDAELRRLLYNAAMSASRTAAWRPFYQRHLDRGFTRTQALVALARKLARVAFALMKNQSDYRPQVAQEDCIGP